MRFLIYSCFAVQKKEKKKRTETERRVKALAMPNLNVWRNLLSYLIENHPHIYNFIIFFNAC